jgi:hypothetical protein
MADLNKCVAKNYTVLRDATIVQQPVKSRSVWDLYGIHLKQKNLMKYFPLASWAYALLSMEQLKK